MNDTLEYSDLEPTVQQLLQQWGFASQASAELVAHARACDQCSGQTAVFVVETLGLLTAEQLEQTMQSRPANVLPLEHLAKVFPALTPHVTRIQAIERGLPYLSAADERHLGPSVQLSNDARSRLDELNAALVRNPDGGQLLVFSEQASLLEHLSASVVQRMRDPLWAELEPQVVCALAPSVMVSRLAKGDAEQPLRVVSAAAQDNFWAPSMARTEAERVLARLLDEALSRRATDVELAPQRDGTGLVRIRIYGDMVAPSRHAVLSPAQLREITNFLVSRSRAGDGGRLRRPADGQLTYKNAQVEVFIRASFIPADRFGLDFDMVSTSLRLLPRTARRIELADLNLGPLVEGEIRRALMRTQGLIVLAGPTNSGKSTTVAGVVGEHFKLYGNSKKRLSLEDPVERYLEGITQISVEGNFAELMRALLRHDPDLVWVGEIRDAFSAAACVRAATSGHIVLSTVHANNSILAFRAIANYLRHYTGESSGAGASLFDLAESVSLLIGQRLVKRLCPSCRQPRRLSRQEWQLLTEYLKSEGLEPLIDKAHTTLKAGVHEAHPGGCKACNHLGYVGEMPINELLPGTREVRQLLSASQDGLDFAALAQHRLNTLVESALDLVAQGETDISSLYV